MYKGLIRPFLFRLLTADQAHGVGQWLFRHPTVWTPLRSGPVDDDRMQVRLGGLTLKNPLGMAPGFDKDCEMLESFQTLGFGYALPGSIQLRQSAEDNPTPRFRRLPELESLVQCVRIPSRGVDYVRERLQKFQAQRGMKVIPVIENLTSEDTVEAFRRLRPLADGIEISLRCPNEPGTRYESNFHDPDTFRALIAKINEVKTKPVFVKMRNYVSTQERDNRMELADLCVKNGVDGVTISGTVIVDEPRISAGRGILSGRAILSKAIGNVSELYCETQGKLCIKARGGVHSAVDAFEAIRAGASTVELLTGLIYEGPSVAQNILRGLLRLLDLWGYRDISEVIGTAGHYRVAATVDLPTRHITIPA